MSPPTWPTARHPMRIVLPALVALVVLAAACSAGRSRSATSKSLPASGAFAGDSVKVPAASTTIVGGPAGQSGSAGPSASAAKSGLGADVVPAQPQVVRNANVVVDVTKGTVPASYDAVANLATANGGFVADSSLSTMQGAAPSGRLTLRIPVDHLQAVLAALGKLGKVTQQDQQGADVTGQLVDLAARIRTLQAEEDATRTLLGRAQAIGDILQIQGQLFNLRTQIEQLNGQQSHLSDKAAYATVAVQVVEVVPGRPTTPPEPQSTVLRAWNLAGHNIVAVLNGAALAVGWLAPVLIVALLGLPALVVWRRRVAPTPAPSEP